MREIVNDLNLSANIYFMMVLFLNSLMADTVNYPHGSQYSFGIDENTALVVTGAWHGGRSGEVIGESGVTLFDMTVATTNGQGCEEGTWRLSGLRVSHLTRGDKMDLQSYHVTPAEFKKPLAVREIVCCHVRTHPILKARVYSGTREEC